MDKKICNKCGCELSILEFNKNGNYRRGICKKCLARYDAKRNQIINQRNRVRQNATSRKIQTYIESAKINRPCYKCGVIFEPYAMHFDHEDRLTKRMNVSNIKSLHSLKLAKLELEKCSILCVFCHRTKTALESKNDSKLMRLESKIIDTGPQSKICIRCGLSQAEKDFIICKGIFINVCKQCERERSRVKRKVAFEYINAIKSTTPCTDCGITMDPIHMDFDHLPEYKKEQGISIMCSKGCSIKLISKEISKCQVVCARCHARRTYLRNNQ